MSQKPPQHRSHRATVRHSLQPAHGVFTPAYRQACRIRSSAQWQAVRLVALSNNPVCRLCNRPATEVHHVEQVARRPDLAFDLSNLVALCNEHHTQIESAERRGVDTTEVLKHGQKRTKANPYRNPEATR